MMPSVNTRVSAGGLTLIELIIVLLILSLGAASLLLSLSNASLTLRANEETQTAAQIAQACAEHILMQKRRGVIDVGAIPNGPWNVCDGLESLGYTRQVRGTHPFTDPACPAGDCAKVDIQVSGQFTPTTLTLMLVQ